LPVTAAPFCWTHANVLLLDLTHTSHTQARTGIQKVCRSLFGALASSVEVQPICHDPYRSAWRSLQPTEMQMLSNASPGQRRGARWPLATRFRGRLARMVGAPPPRLPHATGLIVPEIFSPATAHALPELLQAVGGARIALFHDAIALKYPELSPSGTVGRFPHYLQELLAFDGVAAVSEDSRDALLDYWQWLGVKATPPVHAIPLGIDDHLIDLTEPTGKRNSPPVVLCVGTLEARKNHLALLEACESLWAGGLTFELHLIGMAQAQTGQPALDRIHVLQAAGRSLRYDGPVSDNALQAAYRRAAFTVYPSIMEGFGLPILESLRYGRPCICSSQGALGESARSGGCLTLDPVGSGDLAQAIRRLLTTPSDLEVLVQACHERRFKTWSHYGAEVLAWMTTLNRRSE
jgi:glycosyltransferase involved in cell wall biosynthesis